jgi:F0F1-type ATP synthase membrane subunit c/vacuolar-type H+-ATPase subunit K
MNCFPFPRRRTAVLMTAGALCGMVALWIFRSSSQPKATPPNPAAMQAWEKINPRLRQADSDGAQAGEEHLQRIKDFFAEKQTHVRDFAEEVLGLSGKWAFVKGKLFGDDGKGHQAFLRKAFEQHIFTNGDLQNLLQVTITGLISELDGQENSLLVSIRADLSEQDLPAVRCLAAVHSDQAFLGEYRKMLAEVIPVVSRDLKITVGREAAVWVGSDIAAIITVRIASAVAVRLGISGGILGTGAASGVATLGVGIGVGFVVDSAVDWIMRQAGYDPAGEIAKQTSAMLVRIQDLLIEGDAEAKRIYQKLRHLQNDDPLSFVRDECRQAADRMDAGGALGLRHEINRLRALRNSFREAALKKILFEGGQL